LRFMGNSIAALCVGACLVAVPAALEGQGEPSYPAIVSPLSGTVVENAPFSATAVLTARGHIEKVPSDIDLLRIWDTYTTRLQRDSAGRVRADYDVPDTSPGAAKSARRPVYQVLTDPVEGEVYLVDPKYQAIQKVGPSHAFDADVALEIPLSSGPLRAEGRLVTNRRLGSTDEQWASPELRLVLYSHHTLPHRGVELEYRLKNISRTEPPASVFELPAGYAKHER
jgi:hypothetical protein